MTTTTSRIARTLAVTAAAALIAACGSSGGDGDKSPTGRLKLSVTDAPVDQAEEVWVQFRAVEFKPEGGAPVMHELRNAGGALDPQEINLLQLQGGQAAVLVNDVVLPAGRYEWIRLIVDNQLNVRDSYIKIDGMECELRIPSGDESGLKMNRGFTLPADGSVALTVDFDLRKSIHAPPGQKGMAEQCMQGYLMRPTLRLVQDSDVGAIAGTVDPLLFNGILGCFPMVYVFADGANAAGTTVPDDQDAFDPNPVVMAKPDPVSGAYRATFLPSGNYTVAYTCSVDDPVADDSATFVFSADKKAAVVQPNLMTLVNFSPPAP